MEEDTVSMLQKYNPLLSVSATVRGRSSFVRSLQKNPDQNTGISAIPDDLPPLQP